MSHSSLVSFFRDASRSIVNNSGKRPTSPLFAIEPIVVCAAADWRSFDKVGKMSRRLIVQRKCLAPSDNVRRRERQFEDARSPATRLGSPRWAVSARKEHITRPQQDMIKTSKTSSGSTA